MGFSYDIQYKSGNENIAADALSRVSRVEVLCITLSLVDSNMINQIKRSYSLDYNLVHLVEELQDFSNFRVYQLKSGLLRKITRLWLDYTLILE